MKFISSAVIDKDSKRLWVVLVGETFELFCAPIFCFLISQFLTLVFIFHLYSCFAATLICPTSIQIHVMYVVYFCGLVFDTRETL